MREIDERLRRLEKSRRKVREALEARANSLTLPQEKDLDRILRYETANKRQLNRTLDRLERLQRLQKGNYVLAPLTVSLEGLLWQLRKLKSAKTKPTSSLLSARVSNTHMSMATPTRP